jgi:hypothetical protein
MSVLEISHADLDIGRRLEVLPLQVRKHAAEFAVADLMTSGKRRHQRGQECHPLVRLQRSGGIDDCDHLRFGEQHGRAGECRARSRNSSSLGLWGLLPTP